jgi:DNA polymerase-3 subunit delta'
MTAIVGHDAAAAAFLAAMRGGALHHAWLLTGPDGVGKGLFARLAAARLLAGATGEVPDGAPLGLDPGSRTASLIAAGAHPDFRILQRLQKDPDKPDLARSISIAQVRGLQPMFATAPALAPARAVVIDAIDDLERGGANALLKNLEEPPQGTIFFLVSHAPGRLLPTIRSRCRLLRFDPLFDREVDRVLRDELPETDDPERAALVAAGEGSPGRAIRYAGLDVAGIDVALARFAEGDRDNSERLKLSRALSLKAAQPRYELFLDRAGRFIAAAARTRQGEPLRIALDAHQAARDLAAAAIGLSLDPQATVIEMAGIVARLHGGGAPR